MQFFLARFYYSAMMAQSHVIIDFDEYFE